MITKWKLGNFKSVKDETTLSFTPLTIFAGANSSGKSTWIQSMLLVSQTVTSRRMNQPVVLNGNLVKLGQFDDLKCYGNDANRVTIGWESHPFEYPLYFDDTISSISFEFAFDDNPASSESQLFQLQPALHSCRLSCELENFDPEVSPKYQRWLSAVRRNSPPESSIMAIAQEESPWDAGVPDTNFDVEMDPDSLKELQEQLACSHTIGCRFNHFVPFEILVSFDERREIARLMAAMICDLGRVRRFPRHLVDREMIIPATVIQVLFDRAGDTLRKAPRFSTPTLWPSDRQEIPLREWIDGVRRLSSFEQAELRKQFLPLQNQIQTIIESSRPKAESSTARPLPAEELVQAAEYQSFFFGEHLRYLGPLRDEPKPLYPLSSISDPIDVGLRGEHTAAVLHVNKSRPINYIPAQQFRDATIDPRAITVTLDEAVEDWLVYLDVAQAFETDDKGKLGHELRIQVPLMPGTHDLTHVGVGVSQVLPILVMCLVAGPDTTLVFEQPELHLHPKVQTRLADFFISMALIGKQCVLETHSEYLINRLRLRAATAASDQISKLVTVYFVEKESGHSIYRQVGINQYGAVPNWPKGFFDESQRESEQILLAAMRKKGTDSK
jgi:predicted ATPase